MTHEEKMNSPWLKRTLPIAALFSFRMLGLFMLIPVFSITAPTLHSATPSLIGLALGAYGLSQGLLQIPFGLLSDKWGRKPMLTIGLLFFIIGSLIGALTHSIYGMIAARVLQGMGAIGSVLIALLADLTTVEDRTKGMAIIGISIAVSFALAMVVSPIITHHFGLAGIFYCSTLLATVGLIMLYVIIPTPQQETFHTDSETNPSLLKQVVVNRRLQTLNLGIFLQHFILTSTFYAVPILLHQQLEHRLLQSWQFYLPILVGSFLMMMPCIWWAEKKQQGRLLFRVSVLLLGLSQLALAYTTTSLLYLAVFLFLYFIGFNHLEALLPSAISKEAPKGSKGTAMGIYSSCQFFGLFAGGVAAGWLYALIGPIGIFLFNGFLCFVWMLVMICRDSSFVSTKSSL